MARKSKMSQLMSAIRTGKKLSRAQKTQLKRNAAKARRSKSRSLRFIS